MEKFNKIFNNLVKNMYITIKPLDEFLLCPYLYSFGVDTTYDLRMKELANLGVSQTEALKMKRARKKSGKYEILGYNKGSSKSNDSKGKAKEETIHGPIK